MNKELAESRGRQRSDDQVFGGLHDLAQGRAGEGLVTLRKVARETHRPASDPENQRSSVISTFSVSPRETSISIRRSRNPGRETTRV
jgi:hypothetical protein